MDILNTINSFVWGPPLMVLLIGTGILLIRFATGPQAAYSVEIDFYGKKYRQRRYQ